MGEFNCTVTTWDGEYTIGLQYLKSFNYLPTECQQMQVICDRINRLPEDENLEDAPRSMLKYLGGTEATVFDGCRREVVGFD